MCSSQWLSHERAKSRDGTKRRPSPAAGTALMSALEGGDSGAISQDTVIMMAGSGLVQGRTFSDRHDLIKMMRLANNRATEFFIGNQHH